jgi:hypothetical protein
MRELSCPALWYYLGIHQEKPKKKNNEKRIYYTSRLSFNDTERSMGIIRWLFVTLNCVSQRFLASLAPYEDPVKVRIKNTTSDGNRTVELADSWHV